MNTQSSNVSNVTTTTSTNVSPMNGRKTKQQSNKLCVWCDQPRTRHDLCNRCRQKVESRAKRLMEQKLKGDWLLFNELKDYVGTQCQFLKTPDQTMDWLEGAGPYKYLALQARNTYDGKRQNNAWQITDSMLLGCVKDLYAHKKIKPILDGREVKLTNSLERQDLIKILEQKCEAVTDVYRQKWCPGVHSNANNMRNRPGRSGSNTRPGMSPLQPLPPQLHQPTAMLAASSAPDNYDSTIPPSIRRNQKLHPTVQKGPGGSIRHVDSPPRAPVKLSPSLREQQLSREQQHLEQQQQQQREQQHHSSRRLRRQFVNVSSIPNVTFLPNMQANFIRGGNNNNNNNNNNNYPFSAEYFNNTPNYGSVRGSQHYGMTSKRFNPMRSINNMGGMGHHMGGDSNNIGALGRQVNRSTTNTVAESEGEIKSVISNSNTNSAMDFDNMNMNMPMNMNMNMNTAQFMFNTPSMATKMAADNLGNYETPDFHAFDNMNNGGYEKLGSVDPMQFNFADLQEFENMNNAELNELNQLESLEQLNQINQFNMNMNMNMNMNEIGLNAFEDTVDCLQFQTVQ